MPIVVGENLSVVRVDNSGHVYSVSQHPGQVMVQQPYPQQPYGQQPYGQQPYGQQPYAPQYDDGMSQYPKPEPPPPYGMNAPPPPGQPAVAVVVGGPPLGPTPANITCPSCHSQIATKVTHESTTKTHLIAILLCLFGCWPCVCLPYCMDSCQNANHHCPACGAFLGTYQN